MLESGLLSRRKLLAASALTAAAGAMPRDSFAEAPAAKKQGPGVYRSKIGSYEVTALYDGIWYLPIDEKFVGNASSRAVDKALAAAFLPPRILPVSFTALMVNTGAKLILIDTGTAGQITDSAGFMLGNLAAAGVEPKQVDMIVISHFHPDHIDGIKTKDGAKVFPNAQILVPEPEWTFWMDDGNMSRAKQPVLRYFRNARRIFTDIAGEVRRFTPGEEVAPGITSIAAYGHTPGHTAFAIASGGQSMLAMSDTAREPFLFVKHPQWQPSYDMDGPMAAATRERMLDRAAADRMLVEAYHFPFPASGHIAKTKTGYELEPVLWQPL